MITKKTWRGFRRFGIVLSILLAIGAVVFFLARKQVYHVPEGHAGLVTVGKKFGIFGSGFQVLGPGFHSLPKKASPKVALVKTGPRDVGFDVRLLNKVGGVVEKGDGVIAKLHLTDKLQGFVKPKNISGVMTISLSQEGLSKIGGLLAANDEPSTYIEGETIKRLQKVLSAHYDGAQKEGEAAFATRVEGPLKGELASVPLSLDRLSITKITETSVAQEKIDGKLATALVSNERLLSPLPIVTKLLWKEAFIGLGIAVVILAFLGALIMAGPNSGLVGFFDIIGGFFEAAASIGEIVGG